MPEPGAAAILAWRDVMDATWAQLTASPAGAAQRGGEYRAIQGFLHDEMVNNSNSLVVKTLKVLNSTLVTKPQAYALWASMVRPGGPWDHKERVLRMTEGDNTFTPLPDHLGRIRYDFWSNLHYGYVGIEAGFTATELRLGGNAADVLTRDRTDPGDDLAVRMGIELRERYASGELQPHHIEQAIRRHRAELEETGMLTP